MIRISINLVTGESFTEDIFVKRNVDTRIEDIKRRGYVRLEAFGAGDWWPVSQIQSIQWREHDEVLQSQKEAPQGIERLNAQSRTNQIAVPLPGQPVPDSHRRVFVVAGEEISSITRFLMDADLHVTEVRWPVVKDMLQDQDPNETLSQVGTRWLSETSEDREKKIDQTVACDHRWERDPKANTTICRNCGQNLLDEPPR